MKPQVVKNVKHKATKIEIPFGLSQEECPICLRDPRLHQIARVILPCGHMICGVCHYTIVEEACYVSGAEFFCPLCRKFYNGCCSLIFYRLIFMFILFSPDGFIKFHTSEHTA
jgi:hypothetical protein